MSEQGKSKVTRFKKAETTNVKLFQNLDGRPKMQISIEKIVELKNQGLSNRKIASVLKTSEKTIRNRLREIEEKKEKKKYDEEAT